MIKGQDSKYARAGVETTLESGALKALVGWVRKTFENRQDAGSVKLPLGYFANVIDIGNNMGIAISTDGVGTKLLVAQMMNKYDTVGIDLIAMNVNDVLCVGADPLALVDYVAVEAPMFDLLQGIGKGLYEGAKIAGVTIPGGELAQIKEAIRGVRENHAFDLVGTCIGSVSLDQMVIGEGIQDGDIVLGLPSSGIHSNGLSLARKVFFEEAGARVDKYFPELSRTIGEELLEPTRIYAREIKELLRSDVRPKALIHITGDGFLNLTRVASDVSYVIDVMPEPHPIFELIKERGDITEDEMYRVFNMGLGFCVVVSEDDAAAAERVLASAGADCRRIGHTRKDKKRKVIIEPKKIVLTS